jgi:hypothetical protein
VARWLLRGLWWMVPALSNIIPRLIVWTQHLDGAARLGGTVGGTDGRGGLRRQADTRGLTSGYRFTASPAVEWPR